MKSYKKIITKYLKELGVPANLNGYLYLRYAIELMIEDVSYINKITKRLYPDIAKQFNATAGSVERCIRVAIEASWYRGNKEAQNKVFGYSAAMKKCVPTNSEFIATIADYISVYESEDQE